MMDERTYRLAAQSPSHVVRPASAEEVAAALAQARQAGEAVVPWGAGTKQELGHLPRRYDVALDLTRLDQILEHEPADLVVTVEAGVPLAALQARLAEHGQFLALDPPYADRATLGGTLATNASGPSRLLYGTARDLVLGMRWANPAGELVKSGGKVVKNVVGYDLHKAHIGGLGTLGVIVEATFKVHPLPAAEATVTATFGSASAAFGAAGELWRSHLYPRAVDLVRERRGPVDATGGPDGRAWRLLFWAAGTPATVDRQTRDAAAACRAAGAATVERLEGDTHRSAWQAVREFGRGDLPDGAALVKLTCLPSQCAALVEAIDRVVRASSGERGWPGEHGGNGQPGPEMVIRAGNGVIYAVVPNATVEVVEALARATRTLGGSAVVERPPVALRATLNVWGPTRDDFPLMQALKQQFDPDGVLNPGRFVGGI